MKLVILDSWFHWPPRGGAIRAVRELADGLAKKGIDVVLMVPKGGYRGAIDPKADFLFKIRRLSFFHFDGPNLVTKFRDALDKIRPDAVLIANGNLLKPYMIMACRSYPTVVRLYAYEMLCLASYGILFRQGHLCEFDFFNNPWKCFSCPENISRILRNTNGIEIGDFLRSYSFLTPGFYFLTKASIRQPAQFIVTSRFMAKKFGTVIPQEKITTIPDGVDTDVFAHKRAISDDGLRRISFLGRVSDPLKGIQVCLQACSFLWKRRRDFRLTITGTRGARSVYPFVLKDGWRSEKELPRLYQSSDIVIVPSIWAEPFGLTALEAMSCGTPVIASEVGGLVDLIRDGETGLLFSPGDSLELASKIEVLFNNYDYAKKLGSQAREHVLQNFSWPLIIGKYLTVFNNVVSASTHS